MRAPYQILVFPFVRKDSKILYALFKRKDMNVWQGIAGGGEEGEAPVDTAKREAREEASIPGYFGYIRLSSIATIPAVNICGLEWGEDIPVIPEFAFGVEVGSKELELSHEHTDYKWFEFEEARAVLKWDSNRNALWELDYRIRNDKIDNSDINTGRIKNFM